MSVVRFGRYFSDLFICYIKALDDMEILHTKRSNAGALEDDCQDNENKPKEEEKVMRRDRIYHSETVVVTVVAVSIKLHTTAHTSLVKLIFLWYRQGST